MTRDTDRGRSRDTRALALGSAVSGLLAYLVFALTTRGLGATAAGPVSVLWSYWAFAGAAFTFPLQHWIARTATAHGERAVRETLPRLSVVLLAASLLLGLLAWLAREPLFHRDDLWFPAMVAAVTLGSSITGVVRGGLSARGQFRAVAWSLVAENGLRCATAGALLVADSTSVVAFGLCLVAGHLVMAAVAVRGPVRDLRRHQRGPEPVRVPRRREPGPADRPVRAHRGAGGAGAGRWLAARRHHAVRGAGAVPGAVHAGAGDGRAADHPGHRAGGQRPARRAGLRPAVAADRQRGPGRAGGARRCVAGPAAAAAGVRRRRPAGGRPDRDRGRRLHRRRGQPRGDGRRPRPGPRDGGGTCLGGEHRGVGGAVRGAGLDSRRSRPWCGASWPPRWSRSWGCRSWSSAAPAPADRTAGQPGGLVAASTTDDPNGRSRRVSSRSSSDGEPHQHPVDRAGDRREPGLRRPSGALLEPAHHPLGDEEREHRAEGVRRPLDVQPGVASTTRTSRGRV